MDGFARSTLGERRVAVARGRVASPAGGLTRPGAWARGTGGVDEIPVVMMLAGPAVQVRCTRGDLPLPSPPLYSPSSPFCSLYSMSFAFVLSLLRALLIPAVAFLLSSPFPPSLSHRCTLAWQRLWVPAAGCLLAIPLFAAGLYLVPRSLAMFFPRACVPRAIVPSAPSLANGSPLPRTHAALCQQR